MGSDALWNIFEASLLGALNVVAFGNIARPLVGRKLCPQAQNGIVHTVNPGVLP